MTNMRHLLVIGSLVLSSFAAGQPARALPVFAHRFGLSCEACHTTVPHLNAFGEAFRDRGFQLATSRRPLAIPVAAKFNLAYSSTSDDGGLPKAMVDELELLTGGHAGRNVSYFVEQYVIDGGRPGSTRDAWLSVDNAMSVKVGQFSLPLPVDVEDERDTLAHYAAFDQTVGINPFALFDPKIGVELSLGRAGGAALHALALTGHDPQSGIASQGVDRMMEVVVPSNGLDVSAYRYDGARPLLPIDDRFSRQGLGLGANTGKLRFDTVVQRGWDTSADGRGDGVSSGAGFAQFRWECSPALSAVARYDEVSDDVSGMRRSIAAAIVARPARNMRFTLEGDFARRSSALAVALLFAY